jgi:predicted nucleic acid-binding protein
MKASNRTKLLKLFESVLLPRATILPFAFSAAKKYGEIRSFLKKQGTPLAHADLQIASIALSMNMTLITGNLKHFQRVPQLTAENWLF